MITFLEIVVEYLQFLSCEWLLGGSGKKLQVFIPSLREAEPAQTDRLKRIYEKYFKVKNVDIVLDVDGCLETFAFPVAKSFQ